MESSFSKENTNAVRALAAVLIAFVHLRGAVLNDNSRWLFAEPVGYLCVGVFFYYSGYNLIYNFVRKKRYWKSKLWHVYLPFVICNQVYGFYWKEIFTASWKTRLLGLAGYYLYNQTLWYIQALLIQYILFYILFGAYRALLKKRGEQKENRVVMLLLGGILLLAHMVITERTMVWGPLGGNCVLPASLWVGMVAAVLKEKEFRIWQDNKFLLAALFLLGMLFCHHYYMVKMDINWHGLRPCERLAPIFTALFANTLIIGEKVKSKILAFIGNISYEMYIYHLFFMGIWHGKVIWIKNDSLFVLLYIASLILGSWAIKKAWIWAEKHSERLFKSGRQIN